MNHLTRTVFDVLVRLLRRRAEPQYICFCRSDQYNEIISGALVNVGSES